MDQTNPRVFPVEVNPVKVIIDCKLGNVLSQRLPVPIQHARAKDVKGIRVRREPPAAKADDALNARQLKQPVELVLRPADVDLPAGSDVSKGPVHVRVVAAVCDLGDVHVSAGPAKVPVLEVRDALGRGNGGVGAPDVGAAVGDAPVGPSRGCAGGAVFCVSISERFPLADSVT